MKKAFTTPQGEITVVPIGIRLLPQFAKRLGRSTSTLLAMLRSKQIEGVSDEERGVAALQLLPIVIEDAIDIFLRCCKYDSEEIDIDDVGHEHFPEMIEWWIEQSFLMPGKLKPWSETMSKLVSKMTGQGVDLKKELSSLLSRMDSPEKKS